MGPMSCRFIAMAGQNSDYLATISVMPLTAHYGHVSPGGVRGTLPYLHVRVSGQVGVLCALYTVDLENNSIEHIEHKKINYWDNWWQQQEERQC